MSLGKDHRGGKAMMDRSVAMKSRERQPPTNLDKKWWVICPDCLHKNKWTALRCWYCGKHFQGPFGIGGMGALGGPPISEKKR